MNRLPRKATVLLLDDEESIRQDLALRLQKKGYDVHKASSIDEAKRVINAGEINYAIVDLKVDYHSEVGGVEVVHFLKRNQPQSKAIILSAYDFDETLQTHLSGELDGFVSKGGPKNYILAVMEKLEALEALPIVKKCFVIMPFSETNSCPERVWTDIYESVIKPAVERSGFGYECNRSEGMVGNIIEDILDNLNRADLVIADLTDRNPNVFYELGVRHALRGSTILITQSIEDIPFDLRPYAIQAYDWRTKSDKNALSRRLKKVISEIESKPERGASPVLKYLEGSSK